MRGHLSAWAVLAAFFLLVSVDNLAAGDGELVSIMRNVNAVVEAQGFRINPAYDAGEEMGPEDLAPVQAFEIIRPDGRPVTVGRLYTSCACIRLESPKRTFAPGERAILQLHNITPTPFNGQVYAFYVQIVSPIQATLRFDTFVQSRNAALPNPSTPGEKATVPPAPIETAQTAGTVTETKVGDPLADATTESGDPIEVLVPKAGVDLVEAVKEAETTVAAASTEARSTVDAAREEMDAYFADQSEKTARAATEAAELLNEVAVAADEVLPDFAATVPEPLPPPEEIVQSGKESESQESEAATTSLKPPPLAETAAVDQTPATNEAIAASAPSLETETSEEPSTPESPSPALAVAPAAPVAPEETPLAESVAVAPVIEPPAPETKEAVADLDSAVAAVAEAVPSSPVVSEERPASDRARNRPPAVRVSMITIGVRDMPRAARFYEELGWLRASRDKYNQTAFFQLNGQVIALYPLRELLLEQNMRDSTPAPGGVTLAIHVADKEEVKELYERFIAAGGSSLKPPTEMPSGAVTCYVADPDGNPWEISWVPQFSVDEHGGLWLP